MQPADTAITDPPPRPRRRRTFKLLGTLAFLVALMLIAPVGEWVEALADARPVPVLMGVVVLLLLGGLEAARLMVLGRRTPSDGGALAHLVFAASCVAHLPLGLVGSDVYRAAGLRRLGVPSGEAVGVITATRFLGLAATLLLTCGGVLWAVSAGGVDTGALGDLGAVAAALMGGVVVLIAAASWLGGSARADRLPRWLRDAATAMASLRGGVLAAGSALSIAVAACRIGVVVACGAALHAQVPVVGAVVATGAGVVASVVPSLLGGVGPQEAGLAGTLLLFGVDPGAAVVVALLSRLVSLSGAVVGYGLTWPLGRIPR